MKRLVPALVAVAAAAVMLAAPVTATAKPTPTPSPKATVHHGRKTVDHKKVTHEKKAPKPAATPKPPNSVTFAVWGSDGGQGTDITFSSDSNNQDTTAEIAGGTQQAPAWSSSAIPFNGDAQYYSVMAAFQGPGTLYCSVTVEQNGHRYYKQGQASASAGSFGEACDAQLSSGLLGGWD